MFDVPLAGLNFVNIGAGGLVSLAVVLILTGWLVPRWFYGRVEKEAERWRLAYEKERDARSLSDAQTKELLTVTKTTQSFIKGVFKNSERVREEGDSDEVVSSP